MSDIPERDPQSIGSEWPQCPFLEGRCLLDQLGQALGRELCESLVMFILAPKPGSELSLQRNEKDFISQLTEPMARSTGSQASLSDYQSLRGRLSD